MEEKLNGLKDKIYQNAHETEKALLGYCNDNDEDLQVLFDSEKYSLLGGGKRIRPFLVNEFCRALGGSAEASMPFACAIEMIHNYSLIHDDLPCMDNDDERRGRPTNHKVFGYSTALLAGDALLTKAFLTAASNPYVDARSAQEAVKLIANAAGEIGMIGGQIIDLEGETKLLGFDKLLRLHSLKTGALIECSALLGCLAAGYYPDTEEAKAASEYAKKIGLAYQVIDDVLDGNETEKTAENADETDASQGKTTFITYFNEMGARDYAASLTAQAVGAIASFDNSETLTDLAAYLLYRTY